MELDYWLGIDVGTMFTAAAVHRQDRTEIVELGDHGVVVPSVVHISPWGELTVGNAAERRAAADPQGVMRGFKARLGDDVGYLVRDQVWSAEALLAVLLQHVTGIVREKLGGAPQSVALSYPPSWGCYKQQRLRAAAKMAKLGEVHLVAEPVAVAIGHADSAEPVPSLVLDLGGRSGSVTLVRLEAMTQAAMTSEAAILGAEGIEVGGADFDESLRGVVEQLIGRRLASFDEADPAVSAALAQLCSGLISAKEQLSEETSVELALPLADLPASVRVTRSEFEQAIQPQIAEVVGAARRVQLSAGVFDHEFADTSTGAGNGAANVTGYSTGMSMSEGWDRRGGGDTLIALDRPPSSRYRRCDGGPRQVLLAGGSARVPLLSRMLAQELGLPVVMGPDPKLAVARGAAMLAAGRGGTALAPVTRTSSRHEPLMFGGLMPDDPAPAVPGSAFDASGSTAAAAERSTFAPGSVTGLMGQRGPLRRRALVAAFMVVVAVMVAGGLALRSRGGSPAGAGETLAVARYASPVMQFPDGFVEARQWALHVVDQRLVGTVTVTNNGTAPASRQVEEIFPSTLVEDLAAVEFIPAPDRLDPQNLSVGYDVSDLAAGASETFSYRLAVAVDAEEAQHRLAQWGRDRDRLAAVRTTEPAVSLASLSFERTAIELEEGSVVPVSLSGVLTDGRPADQTMLAGIAFVSSEPSVARASSASKGGSVELQGRRAGRSVVVAQSGPVRASLVVGVRKSSPASTAQSAAPGSGPGTTSVQPRQASAGGSASASGSRSPASSASVTPAASGSTAITPGTSGQSATRSPVGRTGEPLAPAPKTSPAPGTSVAPTTTTPPSPGDLPPADVTTTTAPPTTQPPATTAAPTTQPPATQPPATTAPPTTEPPATTTTTSTEPPPDPPPTTAATDPPPSTAPPPDPPPADPIPIL